MKKSLIFYSGVVFVLLLFVSFQTLVLSKINPGPAQALTSIVDLQTKFDTLLGLIRNGIIVDNSDANVIRAGEWEKSSTVPGFYGPDYEIIRAQTGSFTFTPHIAQSGLYEISTRWIERTNRATNVGYYIIPDKAVPSIVRVNQTSNGGKWLSLGTYNLAAGDNNKVVINLAGSNGYVIADAVRFDLRSLVYTPPVVPTPTPTTTPVVPPVNPPVNPPVPPVTPPTGTLPPNAIIVNPGESIQNAIDNAPVGSTIALRGGTYNEKIRISKTLSIVNYPGEKPIINGGDSGQTATVWFYETDNGTAKNSILSGLEITGGYYGIKIDGGEYHPGIDNGIIIENNKIHDVGFDGIKITFNADNITIKNNEVYRTGRDGKNAQGIDSVGTDFINIQGNYVHDTVSDGIFTKGGSLGAVIENNRVVNAGTGGEGNGIAVGMAATDAYVFDLRTNPNMYECISCVVRNNIVTGAYNSGIVVYGAKDTRLDNNTISDFGTAGVRIAAVENWPVTGGYLQIPSSGIIMTGNKIRTSGEPAILIINTPLGTGLTGSFFGSNNTYYNTNGAVTFRDDTKNFTGGLTGWLEIRTDTNSKEQTI